MRAVANSFFYPVVAYVSSESDIVIKKLNPETNEIQYKQMRWGTLEDDPPRSAKWYPVGNVIYTDPGEAVQSAAIDLDDDRMIDVRPMPFAIK